MLRLAAFVLVGALIAQLGECAKYDYKEVLDKSMQFFRAQRSGKLPADNGIKWRGDSALNDGKEVGVDLTGGWYDAGDHMKFNFPMASATTLLAWGMNHYRQAYEYAGLWEQALDSIKWTLDYFIRCHPEENVLYGQVGIGRNDHSYWGRAEEMDFFRPSFKITKERPGSDLAGEVAAAMAAGSIAFREKNETYSKLLLQHAEQLYKFGKTYLGLYSNSITDAANFYRSYHYKDELAWAAAMLYQATEKASYLEEAKQMMNVLPQQTELSWNEKGIAAALLVYKADPSHTPSKAYITNFIDHWLYKIRYTPKGLAWRSKWSPNRYAASASLVMMVAADLGIRVDQCNKFAENQINYILGDGGRSYVIGFGHNPPKQAHHRGASCKDMPAPCNWNDHRSPLPNPQILFGGLVGGPDEYDNFVDMRSNYVQNFLGVDCNSGFQSAVAGLLKRNMQ